MVVVVGGGGVGVVCVLVVVAGALGIGVLVEYGVGAGVGDVPVELGCIGWAGAALDAVTACHRPPKLSIPWPWASSRPRSPEKR